MKLLMLADDLTGALDSGVQFAKNGISTLILLAPDKALPETGDTEVVSVNLAARHMTPEDAYNAAKAALERFKAPYVYIKTDSALRGNISAVFAAALDSLGGVLSFAPAFPQARRATISGVHYIDGRKLEDSVFRDDPLNPMLTSYLPDILSASHSFPVKLVPNAFSAETPETVIDYAANPADMDGARLTSGVLVFDCAELEDMRRIASGLKDRGLLSLTAGCAGFATVLPEFISFEKSEPAEPISVGPFFCVSGSANEIGLAQIEAGVKSGMRLIFLDPRDVLGGGGIGTYESQISGAVTDGECVIAATARTVSDVALYRETSVSMGIAEGEMHARISAYIAKLVRVCADKNNARSFVIIGGDAAHAVFEELHIGCVSAIGEVEPGVAVSSAVYNGARRVIITKSGAIGSPEALGNIQKYLCKQRENFLAGGK